jgi:hypothetical protein
MHFVLLYVRYSQWTHSVRCSIKIKETYCGLAARSGATCSSTLGGMHGFVSCAHMHRRLYERSASWEHASLVLPLQSVDHQCRVSTQSANRSVSSTDKGVQ